MMRYLIITTILGVGVAFGSDFKLRAPNVHRPNDKTYSFGGTSGAPKVRLEYDTVDADNNFMSVVLPASTAGNDSGCLVVSSDANIDRSLTCDDGAGNTVPELLICSNNQADVDECFFVKHDGVRANIGNRDNSQVKMKTEALFVGEGDGSEAHLHAVTTSTGAAIVGTRYGTGLTGFFGNVMNANGNKAQWAVETSDVTGNQIVIGSGTTGQNKDYDKGVQTNPTLFIHSDTDPDSNNTQYVSMHHDKQNGTIKTGYGNVKVQAAGGELELSTGTFLRRYQTCTCNYNTSGECLASLQADDVVVGCMMKVSTVWNGNGTVTCQIDNGASGPDVKTFANSKLTSTGWAKGFGDSLEGWGQAYVLEGSDNSVDCIATAGTSSQGEATMYVIIERMGT